MENIRPQGPQREAEVKAGIAEHQRGKRAGGARGVHGGRSLVVGNPNVHRGRRISKPSAGAEGDSGRSGRQRQTQARRIQEINSGKLMAAVEALSAAVVSRQALDQEATASARKKRKIDDLRGQLEFAEPGKEEMELRAAIRIAYKMLVSHFLLYTSTVTTPAGVAAPSTPVSESSSTAMPTSTAGVAASTTRLLR